MAKLKQYLWNILIGIDQLANVFLGGSPDETLSSRMGKRLGTCKVCYFICRVLHWIDPGHCKKSIEADEGSRDIF